MMVIIIKIIIIINIITKLAHRKRGGIIAIVNSKLWKANVLKLFFHTLIFVCVFLKWYLISLLLISISYLYSLFFYLLTYLLNYTYLFPCISHKLCEPLTKINHSHLNKLLIFLIFFIILWFFVFVL